MQKSGTKREEGQNKCDGKDHKKLSLSLSVRRESESSLGRGELAAQWVRDIAQERGSWVRDRPFSHLLGSRFSQQVWVISREMLESQLPQLAVAYFFRASVLFSIENGKF